MTPCESWTEAVQEDAWIQSSAPWRERHRELIKDYGQTQSGELMQDHGQRHTFFLALCLSEPWRETKMAGCIKHQDNRDTGMCLPWGFRTTDRDTWHSQVFFLWCDEKTPKLRSLSKFYKTASFLGCIEFKKAHKTFTSLICWCAIIFTNGSKQSTKERDRPKRETEVAGYIKCQSHGERRMSVSFEEVQDNGQRHSSVFKLVYLQHHGERRRSVAIKIVQDHG